jgi:hypothetical protein
LSTPIPIDPLFLSTSIISGRVYDRRIETATSFFWQEGDLTYLITNKHVILGSEFQTNPQPITSVELRCHLSSNLAVSRDVHLPLFRGSTPIWLEHPNPQVDVVVIPIPREVLVGLAIVPLGRQNLPPPNLFVGAGEPLTAIGYPIGFYDEINNLPIARQATMASAFPVPFRNAPMFVTDARMHPGMSGAPVLFVPRGSMRTTGGISIGAFPNILLGINSASWKGAVGGEPLNLNVAWFSSLIPDILGNPQTSNVTLPSPPTP